MKKVFLLMFFVLFCMSGHSQIQRQIFGCTIGVSSRNQVRNILKSKGLKIYSDTSKSIGIENVSFGGTEWTRATFFFYKDKVINVTFIYEISSEKGRDFIYDSIKEKIKKKYSKYGSIESYDGTVRILDEDKQIARWDDEQTFCLLSKEQYSQYYSIFLLYEDKELDKKREQEEENEF